MEITINIKTVKVIGIVALIIMVLFAFQFFLTSGKNDLGINQVSSDKMLPLGKVDKVQVVHFHATQQCWSCTTIGQYSEKIIKTSFPEEYKNGKVEYLDINIDEKANAEIARKFSVSGSSLYINVVREGRDNISEDIQVWSLVSNEQKFTAYFTNKLQGYLQ